MGVRTGPPTSLAKKANAKDAGRRPGRNYGSVPIEQVIPDPSQPRTEFDEDALQELSASFASKGQLQPIRVRWLENEGKWTIIAGERRWRAAQMAGLATIDCYFHDGGLTPSEILEEQIIENLQRRSLQPLEEARSFQALIKMNMWKKKEVASALGIHPTKVSRALKLLKLPADIQSKIESGELPARTAYEISKLENETQQRAMLSTVSSERLTNQQARNRVRVKQGKRAPQRVGTKLTFNSYSDHSVTVSSAAKTTYEAIEAALQIALEEVRHRIENNVQIN
jgi:ParB family chromosome partitioning protein